MPDKRLHAAYTQGGQARPHRVQSPFMPYPHVNGSMTVFRRFIMQSTQWMNLPIMTYDFTFKFYSSNDRHFKSDRTVSHLALMSEFRGLAIRWPGIERTIADSLQYKTDKQYMLCSFSLCHGTRFACIATICMHATSSIHPCFIHRVCIYSFKRVTDGICMLYLCFVIKSLYQLSVNKIVKIDNGEYN